MYFYLLKPVFWDYACDPSITPAFFHHRVSSVAFSHLTKLFCPGCTGSPVPRDDTIGMTAVSSCSFHQGPQIQAGALSFSQFYTYSCEGWCTVGNRMVWIQTYCTVEWRKFWQFLFTESVITLPFSSPNLFSKNAAFLIVLWGQSKESVWRCTDGGSTLHLPCDKFTERLDALCSIHPPPS